MQGPYIRDAMPDDYDLICALNLVEVQHTSPMDAERVAELDELSCYHKVVSVDGHIFAFLLAICRGSPYRNDNFEWFSAKFAEFIYIDRIVVSANSRGLQLGSMLYEDPFRYARSAAIPLVTCEYNISPPMRPRACFTTGLASGNRALSGWPLAPNGSRSRPRRSDKRLQRPPPDIRSDPTFRPLV